MTYREMLQLGISMLQPDSDAEIDARLLLEEAAGLSVSAYLMHEHDEASSEEEARFLSLIRRRQTHEPIAYILGSQEFMGLEFQTSPSVLIPRQDTETLVELALDLAVHAIRKSQPATYRILDLCSGSGCIGISLGYYLKQKYPNALIELVMTDLSSEALAVASENAKNLLGQSGVRVRLLQGDLWEAVPGETFDLIVSNPPYISAADMQTLPSDVADFEPSMALFGGDDGLDFYKALLKELDVHLNEAGRAFFEIGEDQGEALKQLSCEVLPHYHFSLYQDLCHHDRVAEFYRKETGDHV